MDKASLKVILCLLILGDSPLPQMGLLPLWPIQLTWGDSYNTNARAQPWVFWFSYSGRSLGIQEVIKQASW